MEFQTLDDTFLPVEIIDEFISGIWTERYSKVGDVTLVVSPTEKNLADLAEGTFLQLKGSDEVAQIDTALVEEGVLKVTGKMLTAILDERIIREAPTADNKREYSISGVPENVLWTLVQRVVVAGGSLVSVIPDGDKQVIPNLSIDTSETFSGSDVQFSVPYGPLGAGLSQIAETHQLGYKIYLASVSESGYSLKFKVYRGRYLTSDQTVYPVVKFSPAMDTLTGLKQLRSIAGYKTAAYVYGTDDGSHPAPGIAYAEGNTDIGFKRRVILVDAGDITMEVAGGSAATFQQMLVQRAKDTLANNNYTKMVDGEVVPQSEFRFGVHYLLGDVVELDGGNGISSKARITEYIRSQDQEGERAYPTVSVIE